MNKAHKVDDLVVMSSAHDATVWRIKREGRDRVGIVDAARPEVWPHWVDRNKLMDASPLQLKGLK